jgi:hypothetical protein
MQGAISDRLSVGTIWNELIVPIFIERFLMVVCAAAFYGLVVTNNMNMDAARRVCLGIALVATALFLGLTSYKPNRGSSQATPGNPSTIDQTATDSNCSNVVAGKDATVDCSPSPENKNAPEKEGPQKH